MSPWGHFSPRGRLAPVTVKTRWTGTWASNDVDQGPITPQPNPVTATTNIRVDEVQTLVRGTR